MVHCQLTTEHIPQSSIFTLFLEIIGIYKRIHITGHSMWPVLNDTDVIFIRRRRQYLTHDIVVANHPYKKILVVKKIEKIDKKKVYLVGINRSDTQDSGTFGPIDLDAVVGKVLYKKQLGS